MTDAPKKRGLPAHLEATKFTPGCHPPGRPKGSRNKFAEKFIRDFMKDWEKGGIEALQACRLKDPAAYINAAAKIIPKEFNINSGSEAELERFLERYSDAELQSLIAGLVTVGKSGAKETAPVVAGTEPDSVH